MTDEIPPWVALHRSFDESLEDIQVSIKKQLHDLTVDACREVGSLESSILIPDEDPDHLRFFVSVNPALEEQTPTVPMAESLVGYVFQTGQLIAVDKPEDYYRGVDQLTGTETREYIAIPLHHQSRVLGVQTFMNRPEGGRTGSFTPEEMDTGQHYASLASVILRYYERLEFLHQMTRAELNQVVIQSDSSCPQNLSGPSADETSHLFMEIIQKIEGLPPSDLQWINELVEVGLKQLNRPRSGDLEF